MTRFNKNSEIEKKTKTVNLAGGEAFAETPKLALVSFLLTSFVKNQFYKKEKQAVKDLKKLIKEINDKKFVAKSAIYARDKFGMRTVSHLVAGEIAKEVKGEEWTKNFYEKVVIRPDDMTEIASYYLLSYGKPMPNSLKKGLGLAFQKFNEYKLAKYKGEDKAISLVDLANLVHPMETKAIKKLMTGKLKSADTWEVGLTKAGQKAKEEDLDVDDLKNAVWTDLIKEKKIGYFALLRNLRNILEQSSDNVKGACKLLVDEEMIKGSRVLPFRFMTAIDEIKKLNGPQTRLVLSALVKAMDISLSNVPKLKGDTLVVVDGSGSMDGRPIQIASIFAAALYKANNADLMLFSDDAKYVSLMADDSVVTLASQIENSIESGGTNFHAIFEEANRKYDRIIILSDMQGWIGYETPVASFNTYKKRTGANPFIYSFDLAGLGSLEFPEDKVFALAGFSDKVFDIMELLEKDRKALIHEIDKIEL